MQGFLFCFGGGGGGRHLTGTETEAECDLLRTAELIIEPILCAHMSL